MSRTSRTNHRRPASRIVPAAPAFPEHPPVDGGSEQITRTSLPLYARGENVEVQMYSDRNGGKAASDAIGVIVNVEDCRGHARVRFAFDAEPDVVEEIIRALGETLAIARRDGTA